MAKKKSEDQPTIEQIKSGDVDIFFNDLKEEEGVKVLDLSEIEDSKANNTGSLSLDLDLIRAIPEGGLIEILGDEGSGKSSLCLEALGQAVLKGKICMYVDKEGSLQRSLVQSIRTLKPYVDGMFNKDPNCPIRLVRIASAEKALETVRRFAVTFPGSMSVIDSVDSLVPEARMAEAIGVQTMGGNAKLMSEALRVFSHDVTTAKSTVLFINQKRDKVGMVFGNPEQGTGGRGLRYYSWQRVELLKPSNASRIVNPDKEIIGHRVRYKLLKNKLGPNFGAEGDFPLLYGKGIFRELEVIEMCCKFNLLQTGGQGGGKVTLPLAKAGKLLGGNATKTLSKFNAGRYLLLDTDTYDYWLAQLYIFLEAARVAPKIDNEISDPQGA